MDSHHTSIAEGWSYRPPFPTEAQAIAIGQEILPLMLASCQWCLNAETFDRTGPHALLKLSDAQRSDQTCLKRAAIEAVKEIQGWVLGTLQDLLNKKSCWIDALGIDERTITAQVKETGLKQLTQSRTGGDFSVIKAFAGLISDRIIELRNPVVHAVVRKRAIKLSSRNVTLEHAITRVNAVLARHGMRLLHAHNNDLVTVILLILRDL